MREQPVDSRDAHVEQPSDPAAHDFGAGRGLLGDGDVGGAARRDDDVTLARRLGSAIHDDQPRGLVPDGILGDFADGGKLRFVGARREEHVAVREQLVGDRAHLGGSLAFAEDHLGKAGAHRAVVIDACFDRVVEQAADLGERERFELPSRVRDASADRHKQLAAALEVCPDPWAIRFRRAKGARRGRSARSVSYTCTTSQPAGGLADHVTRAPATAKTSSLTRFSAEERAYLGARVFLLVALGAMYVAGLLDGRGVPEHQLFLAALALLALDSIALTVAAQGRSSSWWSKRSWWSLSPTSSDLRQCRSLAARMTRSTL